MNYLVWNIRGIGNNPSIRRLKKLFRSNTLSYAAIFEPKVDQTNLNDIMFKLKCDGAFSNDEGNIWILWKSHFKCSIIHACSQYVVVQTLFSNIDVIIFFVHANCDIKLR